MHLPGPELPRFAVVTAALTLLLILAGAVAGGANAGSPLVSGRPHLLLALAVGAMTVLLLFWLIPANLPAWVRGLGWIALGLFTADSGIMALTPQPPAGAGLAVPHAIAAPLFLGAVVLIAVYTSIDWLSGPQTVSFAETPYLPLAAFWTPPLVLVQISLGALYRHKVFGVLPHMAGAMVVAGLVLVTSVMLLQNLPGHPTLRPIAIGAMCVFLLQVSLGIATLVMRLLDFDTSPGFVFLAAAHVCTGALTLAASLLLAVEVRRCAPSGRPA